MLAAYFLVRYPLSRAVCATESGTDLGGCKERRVPDRCPGRRVAGTFSGGSVLETVDELGF